MYYIPLLAVIWSGRVFLEVRLSFFAVTSIMVKSNNTKKGSKGVNNVVSVHKPKGETSENDSEVMINGDKLSKLLKNMFDNFSKEILTEVSEIKQSINFMSAKFDEIHEEISKVKEEMKVIKKENIMLKEENENLSFRLNEAEQYSRRENIVIYGIPDTQGENLYEIVKSISKVTGAENYDDDISITHRLPTSKGKTRPIVIRFSKRHSRDEWLKLFKEETKRHNVGFGIPLKKISDRFQSTGVVTAGDHLTPWTRNLFQKTKEATKDLRYKYAWIRDSKIYVRKNESSAAKRILDYYDLDKL